MKSYGEKIFQLHKVKKVLMALPVKFDLVVVENEESKELPEMELEELQASFEVYEMRLKQRDS